jgi:hypothetical protein
MHHHSRGRPSRLDALAEARKSGKYDLIDEITDPIASDLLAFWLSQWLVDPPKVQIGEGRSIPELPKENCTLTLRLHFAKVSVTLEVHSLTILRGQVEDLPKAFCHVIMLHLVWESFTQNFPDGFIIIILGEVLQDSRRRDPVGTSARSSWTSSSLWPAASASVGLAIQVGSGEPLELTASIFSISGHVTALHG